MGNRERIEEAIRSSWRRDTSANPERWTEGNPARDQCASTAPVVQDRWGGEIVWAMALLPDGSEESHYFNIIEGEERDFTRNQFREGTIIPKGIPKTQGFESTREYILSYPDTERRYRLLASRVEEALNSEQGDTST